MSETLTNQMGEQLKAARLAKNLSLDDVQAATKIQARYLEAIENNNLSILPGDFYVRAFIRQYAIAVGLNPDDLLGETTPPSISRSRDLSRAHRDNDGVVRAGTNPNPSPRSKFSDMLPTVWLVLLIMVVLVAVWFAMTHLTSGNQQSSDGGNVSVSTSTIPSSSSSNSSASQSTAKKPAEKPAPKLDLGTPEQNTALQTTVYNLKGQDTKEHTIKITGQGAGTNVKVTAGTAVLTNEMVTADKTITVPAGTAAVNVQFTNVTNAVMTFDDQKVTVIGSATPFWNVLINLNK
ncbi:helix-turn-helix domain-containing protein [Leuconostoc holzapfelii]|uniref:Helix-turn-helix domain-containing protein n=1 Tax=Leuconostoc holzapfelii TaxID=434464 RepID=A0ABT2NT52_9LACO|nr:helix-turn-helix transcriptional regulator [Leuconostoc holzapfelii]MCT8388557.1 helix-turn-helix domain-containing protein [Leuconostoc holzapfelii]